MLRLLLNEKNQTLYKLEKLSHVSHATLNDLYNEKTKVEKCSSSLIHEISKALDMSMDNLYSILSYDNLSLVAYDDSFDLFKSNVSHELVELSDINFLKKHLSNNTVFRYFKNNKLVEAVYLLSTIDYICTNHNLPLAKEYDEVRKLKMKKLYVSKSVYYLLKSKKEKISDLYKESIPSFLEHNILEANLYDSR